MAMYRSNNNKSTLLLRVSRVTITTACTQMRRKIEPVLFDQRNIIGPGYDKM